MPKSRTDYIREELERDFDASAAVIVERLAKKGVRLSQQHVYQARSTMRQKLAMERDTSRQVNAMPLGQHILNVLTEHPEGLSDRDLVNAVSKAGYISRSSDFLTILRQKLSDLVEKGHIAKNGLQYRLQGIALEKAQKQVAQAVAESTDHALLCDALIDYAKAKGFINPETFPDTLIAHRRQLVEATAAYSSIFESGPAN